MINSSLIFCKALLLLLYYYYNIIIELSINFFFNRLIFLPKALSGLRFRNVNKFYKTRLACSRSSAFDKKS